MIRGRHMMHNVKTLDWINELRLHAFASQNKVARRPILLLEGAYDRWFWQPWLAPSTIAISLNNRNQVLDVIRRLEPQDRSFICAIVDSDGQGTESFATDHDIPIWTYDANNLETWLLNSPAIEGLKKAIDNSYSELEYRTPAMATPRAIHWTQMKSLMWEWSEIIGWYRQTAIEHRWSFRFRLLNVAALLKEDGMTIDEPLLVRTLIHSGSHRKLTTETVMQAKQELQRQRPRSSFEVINGHDWMNMFVHLILRRSWQPEDGQLATDGRSVLDYRNVDYDQTWAETVLRQSVDRSWLAKTSLVKRIQAWETFHDCHLLALPID
jgi:hypothetical protein